MKRSEEFTGERFIPGIEDRQLEIEHIQRYLCAQKVVKNKRVLDAACGEGYGSNILAETAKSVLGIDISEKTISAARIRYASKKNLSFLCEDITNLKTIKSGSVDVVVSFETIEHISSQEQEEFLHEIKRVLVPEGILVMSTPNKRVYSDMTGYQNEFHMHEFYKESFISFLKNCFKNVELYSQSFEVNCMLDGNNGESIDIYRGNTNILDNCKYFVAFAGNCDLPHINIGSVFVGEYGEYEKNRKRIMNLQEEEEIRNVHIKRLDSELEDKGQYIRKLQLELVEKQQVIDAQNEEKNRTFNLISERFTESVRQLESERSNALIKVELYQEKMQEMSELTKQHKENAEKSKQKLEVETEVFEREKERLRNEAEEKEIIIESLKNKMHDVQCKNEMLEDQVNNIESQNRVLEDQINNIEGKNRVLEDQMYNMEVETDVLEKEIIEEKNKSNELSHKLYSLENEYTKVQNELETQQNLYNQLMDSVKEKEKRLEEKNLQYRFLESEFCNLKEENLFLVQKSETLENEKNACYDEVSKYQDELKQYKNEKELEREQYSDQIAQLRQVIRNKEGHIELLLQVEREYECVKNQRSFKIGQKIHKISSVVLPGNSTRRLVVSILIKCVRHPIKMFKFFTPHRIGKFFYLLRQGGMSAVKYRYRVLEADLFAKAPEIKSSTLNILDVKTEQELSQYESLKFEKFAVPEVSIIIPVYNQFEYTYNCLKSILTNTVGVSYEIIIADDCSMDLTVYIEKVAENIKVIRNVNNLGFLKNCNHAAAYAEGEFVLFLNNDTQVQDNWLKPLVDLMRSNPKAGLVGSKLVYATGQLQEAGGILWKDGSAWNWGNGKDPSDPEFNYVKEADYISGAAIMIRKSLWAEIGGFDEQYAPAYYEDTDLAFEVRRHGYQVVYQPLSVVVHFEGISNGTDVNEGMKSYQVINAKKFYDKWKQVLEREHFANGENVFLAKDRSRYQKQILVVDHYVPHYDKDAGGRCTYMYLKLFRKLGFKVTFIGDNFFKHEPYTTELNQMGIEVLYGNFYYNNWQEWLKENLHYFDYIYLQRPHISIKYIDIVKEYARGKIFYFAHDLHFLRLQREYELTKNIEAKEMSEKIKKDEYYLFDKTDVIHVVGSYEQQLLAKEFPEKPVRNIPLYIYDKLPENINKNFKERKDILFVGGFGHTPNIDAVLWFAKEVFPLILEKFPDLVWHIVGGKAPEEVKELACSNIIIEGFLSDEDLERLYRSCRMAVVPLRVGAGVKGKVVEAAYYQIPLMTTTIGGEGISKEEGAFLMQDDATKMASEIIALYEDFDRLFQISENGKRLIEKYYSLEQAEKVLNFDL